MCNWTVSPLPPRRGRMKRGCFVASPMRECQENMTSKLQSWIVMVVKAGKKGQDELDGPRTRHSAKADDERRRLMKPGMSNRYGFLSSTLFPPLHPTQIPRGGNDDGDTNASPQPSSQHLDPPHDQPCIN